MKYKLLKMSDRTQRDRTQREVIKAKGSFNKDWRDKAKVNENEEKQKAIKKDKDKTTVKQRVSIKSKTLKIKEKKWSNEMQKHMVLLLQERALRGVKRGEREAGATISRLWE